jgi:ABC-type uncharacterized transport system involved in gliding motility auxiliary subunit
MKNSWLTARQTKFTAYVTVYILIVIAALGLVNWLAQRYNKSVDTTANKRFSLSDQTVKIVKELKQPVVITYWDNTSSFQQAKDLLDRYDGLSGDLSVTYVDPVKRPQDARAAGVRQLGTITVQVGTKRDEAKSLTEEEITGAIIRSIKGGDRTLCFVTGSGESQLEDTGAAGFAGLKQIVERDNYKTRSISLLEKAEVPKDCRVVVVGGPKFDYLPAAVDALRKYVEGGGRALIMLETPVQLGKDKPVSDNAPLAKMLQGWGVTLQNNFVLDASGIGSAFGFDASVPLVRQYDAHPIGRTMGGVATAFPMSRSLDVKSVDKASAEKLFSTTEDSLAATDLSTGKVDPAKTQKGPFTLGAAVSYNTGQPNSQGRVVVVGSSAFAANGMLGFNGNRNIVLNMLNWLSSDEDLISIRPKDPADNRIMLSRQQMTLLFFTSVVLMPLAVIAMGVGVWWRRR